MNFWVLELFAEFMIARTSYFEASTWEEAEWTHGIILGETNVVLVLTIQRQAVSHVGCLLEIVIIVAEHVQIVLI